MYARQPQSRFRAEKTRKKISNPFTTRNKRKKTTKHSSFPHGKPHEKQQNRAHGKPAIRKGKPHGNL
jgi:hypothetical protein